MKQLAIFLAIVILGAIGYNQFINYRRFHPAKNYEIVANNKIDLTYYDKAFLNEYYRKIGDANSYALECWVDRGIDVRAPKKSNDITNKSVEKYNQLKADVNYFEAILIQSNELKTKGYSNSDIQEWQTSGVDPSKLKEFKQNNEVRESLMNTLKSRIWSVGDKGAGVWELQKLLKAKGYDMPVDGIFSTLTKEAILDFETKNNLYPDGVIDEYALNLLLRP
jgi:hypothetical protein